MAMKAISATRRRNVTPTSSILRIVTRDVDCSAFPDRPEDGQFVCAAGDVATNPFGTLGDPGTTTTFFGSESDPTCTDAEGSSLKMVWASALQTDRQSLGDTKVPVLWLGGIEVECKLLAYDDSNTTLAAAFPPGTLLSVIRAPVAVQGSTARLILAPMADGDNGWAVGYVTKSHTSNDSANDLVAANKGITVMLYDQPRKVGNWAD